MEWSTVSIISVLMFVATFIGQVFDGISTTKILKSGGQELNPIVKKTMDLLGVQVGLWLWKFISIVCAGWMAKISLDHHGTFSVFGAHSLNDATFSMFGQGLILSMTLVIVWHNAKQWRKI